MNSSDCPLCRSAIHTLRIRRPFTQESPPAHTVLVQHNRHRFEVQLAQDATPASLQQSVAELLYLSAPHVKLMYKQKLLSAQWSRLVQAVAEGRTCVVYVICGQGSGRQWAGDTSDSSGATEMEEQGWLGACTVQ